MGLLSFLAGFAMGFFGKDSDEKNTSASNKKTLLALKDMLEEEHYDIDKMTLQFQRPQSQTVFMNAGTFFNQINRFSFIFKLVGLYDEYGDKLDLNDFSLEDPEGGDTGDDEDLNGWGDELDSGGFGGWD